MRRVIGFMLVSAMVVVGVACGESKPDGPATFEASPEMRVEPERPYSIIFTTNIGRMTFKLLPAEAPIAVNSFTFLVTEGFFDGMTFHRVLPGVLAESGDPTGTGTGGPGYTFEVEPPQRPYVRGSLAMANDGTPSSNGSRFFIVLGDLAGNGESPRDYTVFGVVKEDHAPSLATISKIEAATDPVMITSVKAIEGCLPNVSMWVQGC